jgi:6-pyruvoyltetrahydropterin/6-carboxytetrahydropterin synthase
MGGTQREAMYEITERYGFTATHRLSALPGSHPCAALHLHRWTVAVVLVAIALPAASRPCEVAELEPVRRYIAGELDGKYLNDVLKQAPTPARLAEHLADWCRTNLTGYVRAVLHSITISTGTNSTVRCVAPLQDVE